MSQGKNKEININQRPGRKRDSRVPQPTVFIGDILMPLSRCIVDGEELKSTEKEPLYLLWDREEKFCIVQGQEESRTVLKDFNKNDFRETGFKVIILISIWHFLYFF